MDSLAYIFSKYNLKETNKLPIEIPNIGRNDLAILFTELGYKTGAEIGTERGIYAEILCKANPGVHLHCVDKWEVYQGYRDHQDQEKLSNYHSLTLDRLQEYNVTYLNEYSMDAVKRFPDGSLDFVYIDANHEWPYVTQDIYYWARKVRKGGIVSGHDYYRSTRIDSKCHVKSVVNSYTYTFRVSPWFIAGADAKIPGTVRDDSRSWFWVV